MEIFKNRCQNRMDKWGAVEGATHIREEAMYCSVEKMCNKPILDDLKDRNLKDYV